MRFNMGCGHFRVDGYVNVDASGVCQPDEVVDLEVTPWPWPSDCAEEILFNHSLEHMGSDPKVFLEIMKEIYRIAAPGAQVLINVPHPRHDNFINDPTHVRPITPTLLELFDRQLNDKWRDTQASNSPLAHYTGVDFELDTVRIILDEPYATQMQSGKITDEELNRMLRHQNNVATEFRMRLVVRK
jgi:hypothetical protein